MRILFLTCIGVAAALALYAANPRPQAVMACSPSLSTLEDHVARAAFIGVVEPITVGDGINRAPTLTPTVTATPIVTHTPTSAPTRRGFLASETPSATATPQELGVPIGVTLAGRSATVSVVEILYGTSASQIEVDKEARARLEQSVRSAEAGLVSSCGFAELAEYRMGHRYMLVAGEVNGALYTIARYPIDADDVLFDSVHPGWTSNVVREATYRRYLAEFPALIRPLFSDVNVAFVDLHRLPLERMGRLLLAIRSGIIAPPDTGSAGLAAGR